jgi:hypothetical protein
MTEVQNSFARIKSTFEQMSKMLTEGDPGKLSFMATSVRNEINNV